MNNSHQYDKKMLKEYLDKFSKEQLMEYFGIVAEYSYQYDLFMEVEQLWEFLKELNSQAQNIDTSCPSVEDASSVKFFTDNPLYFFDYLDRDVVSNMLYRYISNRVIMAENTAETLYNCGREAAMQYPQMVLALQAQFGPRVQVLM